MFLQDFLPLKKFKDSGCLELSVMVKLRLLYDVHSQALTASEMVPNSSGGAGSGEAVSYGLTLKNSTLKPQSLSTG